jgi:hypothetical protein
MIDYRPLLEALAKILCRELDDLCSTRDKYRKMREHNWYRAAALDPGGPWPVPPPPVDTPYDHVIDRLDNALQDTYRNLESIQTEIYYELR